ncbi:MAG TPA: HTTM domain-containing protein, partial [Gemmatales bacterium]|nr:HTTM domain-containing protein [Gemmatales bacterium]
IHLSTASCALDFIGPHAWVDEQSFTELLDLDQHPKYQLSKNPSQQEVDFAAMRKRSMQHYGFSLWFLVNDPFWVLVTYYAGIVIVGLFTVEFLTPVTGVPSWAFHLSYIQRSMMIWFGMDAMISFLLFYLWLSPSGRSFSVDRLLERWRRGAAAARVEPSWRATLGIRLIQIHMCIVYFIAGVAKLQGGTWWNGIATWLTMNAPLFNENIDLRWLADPNILGEWGWHYFTLITTYTTLAFEIAFPFLVWNRYLRPWILFMAVVLHAGIGIFMGLGGFGTVMLAGCMSFLPPAGVRWFFASLTGKRS